MYPNVQGKREGDFSRVLESCKNTLLSLFYIRGGSLIQSMMNMIDVCCNEGFSRGRAGHVSLACSNVQSSKLFIHEKMEHT